MESESNSKLSSDEKERNRLASQKNVKTSSQEMNVKDEGSPRVEINRERRSRRSTKATKTKVARQRENDEEGSPLLCGLI